MCSYIHTYIHSYIHTYIFVLRYRATCADAESEAERSRSQGTAQLRGAARKAIITNS